MRMELNEKAHSLQGVALSDAGVKQLWQPAKGLPHGCPISMQLRSILRLPCANTHTPSTCVVSHKAAEPAGLDMHT